jgi:uncharacterized membrane protein YhaH (DUF805 family)
MGKMKDEIFSTKGRIGRSTYVKRVMMINAIFFIILAVCAIFVFLILGLSGFSFTLYGILMIPIVLLYLVFISIQRRKRLHDFEKGGFAITTRGAAFFEDGTVGPNKYGEDPKGRRTEQPDAAQEETRQ